MTARKRRRVPTGKLVEPERVLNAVYGKSTKVLGMSEKRRDEVIAAALFLSFWNQEYGTTFKLPADYKKIEPAQDAEGIDVIAVDKSGRYKELQIKGIYIRRSIERRRRHSTQGAAQVTGRRTRWLINRDSDELAKLVRGELKKIHHDYTGLVLIINVIADLATQTSLEIAIRKCNRIVSQIKAGEIWFLRNIPVRAINARSVRTNSHAYKLIKVKPGQHTFGFSFSI